MRSFKLEDMIRGWFVGDFSPAAIRSPEFEVAVKHYSSGESEKRHIHKVATEITVVARGRVQMAREIWEAGSIVVLEPGEETGFLALEDSITVVVKFPSVIGDKYEVE
jgi:quercetin dioxygenase-like cupin family protein